MDLKGFGDLAYIATAVGLILLGGGFLGFTRWWTSWVGRTIGAFMIAVDLIMLWTFLLLTGIVSLKAGGVYLLRAVLFGGLCLASWGMLIGFIWAQFFGAHRGSTRRNSREEVP